MTSLHTDCTLGSCELCDLERKVIKAAKAVTDACEGGNPLERGVALAALFLTVEALQEVEGGL